MLELDEKVEDAVIRRLLLLRNSTAVTQTVTFVPCLTIITFVDDMWHEVIYLALSHNKAATKTMYLCSLSHLEKTAAHGPAM